MFMLKQASYVVGIYVQKVGIYKMSNVKIYYRKSALPAYNANDTDVDDLSNDFF